MIRALLARLREQPLFLLGVVLAAALAVRLLGIASRPLWYDEAFSVLFAEKGFAAMLAGTLSTAGSAAAAEEHPLLYYIFLWGWTHLFGESLVAVRLLSILAGVLLVFVVWQLAYAMFGLRTAIGAGLIAALAPFQVHYAQEIRMYIFLSLWLLLATYAYWRGSHGGGITWWLMFAVFAALAQYTHNLAGFYLLALALWPILRRDGKTAKWVLAAGMLALLLYAPWGIHLPAQFAKVDRSYWVARPEPYRIFTLLLYFVTNLPLPDMLLGAGLLIAVLVIAFGVLQTVKAVRAHEPDADRGMLLLYLSFSPAVLLFAFSQWKPIYVERGLLPSGTVFCIWLAWALLETRLARPVQVFAAALLVAGFGIGLHEHVAYAGFPYAPYAALDAHLESARKNADVIIHSNKISMLPAVYYDRRLPQTYIGDPPGSAEDTLAHSTQKVLGLVAQPDLQSAIGNANRVWYILSDRSNQEFIDAGYAGHPDLIWLQQHYSQAEASNWGDLRLYLFLEKP